MSHAIRSAAMLVLVLIVATVAGCGHRLQTLLLPETRPGIRLDHVRLAAVSDKSYAYLARWSSPGAAVAQYVCALDPVSVDRVDASWVRTTATERVLSFPSATDEKSKHEAHVFAVRAVDADGVMSEPAWFAFTQDNLPPMVQITSPNPGGAFTPTLPPTVTFQWQGTDPDGQTTTTPVRYTFRLFGRHNPDHPEIIDWIAFALNYPDSVRAYYAPDFPGWTSVSGETTSFQYTGLIPGSMYLFMITAFDEAGDYDPVFANGRNMMKFVVVFPGTTGPLLTMFNQFFNYTYPSGGYLNDPSRYVRVEVPAGQPITVNWFATPVPGSDIAWYRWSLGSMDLTDETPRTNEATDLHRWSTRSLTITSATLPPVNPPPGRIFGELLYIEAQDTNGLRSLGIVELVVQRASFSDELLFVDDTRMRPDFEISPGVPEPPAGPWPTAAELDTFLFARGGVPWRGYPEGTLSPPGIFNGYRFDTLGTRGLVDGVPLSVLGRYRHVVWYTDENGATFAGPPGDKSTPITALRLMNSPGRANALAAYILAGYMGQGGNVWLCGGGAAYATLITWNKANTSPSEYTALEPNPELRPGRMMYDFAHWREGIQMLPAVNARKFGTTTFGVGTNRPGRHWPPNPPLPTPAVPPDYSLLPATLDAKNLTTDPPPPLRNADSFWLRGTYNAEYIHRSTFIREDYNDDPDLVNEFSTLDTLYITRGGTALLNSPVMTYYHGRENQPFVFSGFNFWYWRRSQCIGLVDWVLQSVWGLERDPAAPRSPAAAPLAAGARVTGTPVSAARAPAMRGALSRGAGRE